ncbi:TPA: hypothetical protein ACHJA6_005173, partial [Klebsiella pneumoniae]
LAGSGLSGYGQSRVPALSWFLLLIFGIRLPGHTILHVMPFISPLYRIPAICPVTTGADDKKYLYFANDIHQSVLISSAELCRVSWLPCE